ncbi:curli production assembly/transport component CsgF [Flavobacterium sp.]|uniref:curli production assembly/transport component CsgF n=1 Tax=Flavobacterium sp. TaxID=239 RepID=UPI00375030A9
MKILLNILFMLIAGQIYSQDLVYKPKNPNFGGDTFNYQWLLSSAEAQNLYKEEDDSKLKQKTDLQKFSDNLNNQLLNQVSKSLFQQQFGTSGVTTGVYSFGSLSVEIYQSNLGLVVSILDINTGEQTQIIIP